MCDFMAAERYNMSLISDSFVKQFTELATAFETSCAAAALFYWGEGNDHGLRVEATAVMKEFVNNIEFGRDPEGYLFYNAPSDFNFDSDDDPVTYKVYYNSEKPMAVRVDFFAAGSTNRFSSFISKDTKTIDSRLLRDGSGTWRDLKLGTSYAIMHKISTDTKVTLKMAPIGKEATFNVIDNSGRHAINISGIFHFNKQSALTSSSNDVANYDEDRLIFYPNNDHNLLTGVFFPNEPIPIDDHAATQPPSVSWIDLPQ
ncbi:hypothetical protein BC834DRAFT_899056 [Gloeopeniophorella convolvens]|nr:hypothetical protein BC834DRAFT_899056 [Gloeopeniophorella convolvens]